MAEEAEVAEYPMNVRLSGRRCLVIGGGAVAERKIAALLAAGARVTVIAPGCGPGIAAWAAAGRIELLRRTYQPGDVTESGALLVFAASGDAEANRRAAEEAERAGKLCNCADDPAAGSFSLPASVRRGGLLIAVSTGGASPSAARAIAADIAGCYGEEYAAYVAFLSELRERVLRELPDREQRTRLLKEAAADEATALAAIREGAFEAYRQTALERLARPAGRAGD